MQSTVGRHVAIIATFVLLVIAVSVHVTPAQAIRCYVCQSNVDPKCADPFDNLTLPITDCDAYPRADLVTKTDFESVEERGFFLSFGQPAPVKPLSANSCRKVRQKVHGEWRTVRSCGYLNETNEIGRCQTKYGAHDIFVESCACDSKDACNAAQSLTSSGAYLISMTLIACLLSLTVLKR